MPRSLKWPKLASMSSWVDQLKRAAEQGDVVPKQNVDDTPFDMSKIWPQRNPGRVIFRMIERWSATKSDLDEIIPQMKNREQAWNLLRDLESQWVSFDPYMQEINKPEMWGLKWSPQVWQDGKEWNDNFFGRMDPFFEHKQWQPLKNIGRTYANAIPSAVNVVSDIGNMALNPIDTAKWLLGMIAGAGVNVGKGAIKAITGDDDADIDKKIAYIANSGGALWQFASLLQSSEWMADAVFDALKERYWSIEAIGQTITEDPIWVVSDIAWVVEWWAWLLSRASKWSKFANLAGNVSSAAGKIDPYNVVMRWATDGAWELSAWIRQQAKRWSSFIWSLVKNVLPSPEWVLQRMNRLTALNQRKFFKQQWKSVGERLNENWIVDWPQGTVEKLSDRFARNIEAVDNWLNKIEGEFSYEPVEFETRDGQTLKYEWDALKDMMEEAVDFAERTKDPRRTRMQELLDNYNKKWSITMSESNEVKRYFQKNAKFSYGKDITAAVKTEKLTNIDRAVRAWQMKTAKENWFSNLAEINKDTQASKMIIDKLTENIQWRLWNNSMSLTDWIVAAWASVEPAFIAWLIVKKWIQSERLAKIYVNLVNKINWKSSLAEKVADLAEIDKINKIKSAEKRAAELERLALPEPKATTVGDSWPIQTAIPPVEQWVSRDVVEINPFRFKKENVTSSNIDGIGNVDNADVWQVNFNKKTTSMADSPTQVRWYPNSSSLIGEASENLWDFLADDGDVAWLERAIKHTDYWFTPLDNGYWEIVLEKGGMFKTLKEADVEANRLIESFNKAVAAKSALKDEARKYKSADEFIKAQWKPLFHWTRADFKEFDISKAWKRNSEDLWYAWRWIYFTNSKKVASEFVEEWWDLYLSTSQWWQPRVIEAYVDIKPSEILKVKDFGELERVLWLKQPKWMWFVEWSKVTADKIPQLAKSKWYKAIEVDWWWKVDWIDVTETVVFDDKLIKTKEQLKQIYEEANKWASKSANIGTDLIEEARKYKSADEFVESKVNLYHWTTAQFDDFSLDKMWKQWWNQWYWINFTTDKKIASEYTKSRRLWANWDWVYSKSPAEWSSVKGVTVELDNPIIIERGSRDRISDYFTLEQYKKIAKSWDKIDRRMLENDAYNHLFDTVDDKKLLQNNISKMPDDKLIEIQYNRIKDDYMEWSWNGVYTVQNKLRNNYTSNSDFLRKFSDISWYDWVIDRWYRHYQKAWWQDAIYVVFDPKKIKTETQLRKIREEANK